MSNETPIFDRAGAIDSSVPPVGVIFLGSFAEEALSLTLDSGIPFSLIPQFDSTEKKIVGWIVKYEELKENTNTTILRLDTEPQEGDYIYCTLQLTREGRVIDVQDFSTTLGPGETFDGDGKVVCSIEHPRNNNG